MSESIVEDTITITANDGRVNLDFPHGQTIRTAMLEPDQARTLAGILYRKASDIDRYPGSKEPGEYFIDFRTDAGPEIQAVRVRIDLVPIVPSDVEFSIDLVNHPLYKELVKYVQSNPK